MKIKNLYWLILILSFTYRTFPQDGWFWQNPWPTGNPLNDVCFIDVNTGWAAGEYGTIIKTTDGGDNWTIQSCEKTYHLNGIYFSDANNGVAVGFDNTGSSLGAPFFIGIILRTTDGGENWIMQSNDVDCKLNGVFFTDDNNGTAVGGGTAFGGGFGTILRTSDGGEHWITQLKDTLSNGFNSVYFSDENTGTVVGGSKILRTTDGGDNWFYQNSSTSGELNKVCFVDNNIGWILCVKNYEYEKNVILKTTDGGNNWLIQLIDSTSIKLTDIYFFNADTGIAIGDTIINGHPFYWSSWSKMIILKTIDGGKNWISQPTGAEFGGGKLSFIDSNIGTVVGAGYYNGTIYGTILRTIDGGKNWVNQIVNPVEPKDERLYDICFTDANNGTAVGYGTILRTTDGGHNWVNRSNGIGMAIWGVCFTDADSGMVVGDHFLLRTTDGGKKWIKQSILYELHGICFADANTGCAVGENGTIIRTTNGGYNWFYQSSAAYSNLLDVAFTNANTGTAVGENGIILHTTDGGDHWFVQESGTRVVLESVCFTDVDNGTAAGWGIILKTTDGGNNWFTQFTCSYNIHDINFADKDNGTAVGNYLLRTTDGGNSWVKQSIETNNELYGVYFADAVTGWVVGDNGTILHTKNSGVTFVEDKKKLDKAPNEFLLYQNYPNPFNPTTTIKYSIPQTVGNENFRSVHLIVYDVLGREIATLVNEEKPAGTYEVTWNAADQPSGVYFYQLKAGSFSATKKLLLLK
jgi:photosystem II stability/assembly factor-like uncharacterized protein